MAARAFLLVVDLVLFLDAFVSFQQDFPKAEAIILDAANSHVQTSKQLGEDEIKRLEERFGIEVGDIAPRVFWRITENWLELTVRFLGPDHGIRGIKDAMTSDILGGGFDKAGIMIAVVRQETAEFPTSKRVRVKR